MMQDNLTTIPPLPESVVKWGRCLLLHEKIPVMIGDKIKYICMECYNEWQRSIENSESGDGNPQLPDKRE
jgi:hypothetical protein